MAGPSISAATPGLSRLAQALAGGGSAYQRGYDDEVTAQTKIAQALASIRASDSTAAFNEAKTAEQRRANQLASPTALRDQAMLRVGAPTEAADDVDTFLNTGRIDKYNTGGQQGPVMPAPAWAQDQNLGSIAKQIAASQAVLGGSAKSADDYFKGQELFREGQLRDDIVAGRADRNTVGGAQAAIKGSPMYSFQEFGTGDNFSGKVDASGDPAKRYADYRKATTGAQQANAVQSYASADSSRASADKTRAETKKLNEPKSADFKDTTTIRKEFEDRTEVKNFRQAMPVLDAAKTAPDSPQGDLQLIYAVGKILDPNSVVREGEMSMVVKSGSPQERVEGFLNYLQGGGRLSPKARARLIKAVESRTAEYQRDYNQVRQTYEGLAKKNNMDPNDVFMNDRPPAPAAPAARTVVRTGTLNGRKVVQYSDGTTDYAD